jgi:hypothetical protein
MILLVLIWGALLVALLAWAIGKPGEGGSLTLAYFLGLSLIHVPGALAFIDPLVAPPLREVTQVGFGLTLLGLAMFSAGAVLGRVLNRRLIGRQVAASATFLRLFDRLGWRAFLLGVVSYFVILPVASRIPSITSIVAALATLMIIGLWLRIESAVQGQNLRRLLSSLAILPLLPLATLASGGFIGFGVYWALSVVCFWFIIARRRVWFYAASPLVGLLALSLFVTYMGERISIREAVWRDQAGWTDRLESISNIVTNFQMLDLGRAADIEALNSRLNQNYFVGLGVLRHQAGVFKLEYGATVSPLALVPRALWPGKPEVGGGGYLVSRFTGLRLTEGVSFGAGQVLEFYMNFGTAGVVAGFFLFGLIFMLLDGAIMRALARGDVAALLTPGMVGLMLMQPGGNMLEIIVAVAAAYLTARLLAVSGILGRGMKSNTRAAARAVRI